MGASPRSSTRSTKPLPRRAADRSPRRGSTSPERGLIELARWMANYYCCPIETVMRSLLPQVIRRAEVGWKKQLFVHPRADRPDGGDRKAAQTRAAPGGVARRDRATVRADSRRRIFCARRRSTIPLFARSLGAASSNCANRRSRAIRTARKNSLPTPSWR